MQALHIGYLSEIPKYKYFMLIHVRTYILHNCRPLRKNKNNKTAKLFINAQFVL